MMDTTYSITPLTALDEFQRCVEIQGAVWGYDDNDIVPKRLFLLAHKIGGQVIGAFAPSGDMVGFAMALPGYRKGVPYLHSHMLAVLPEHRNSGLGRRLKLAQRDDALARGFDLMEWTYDPLQIKNAYLNIVRLGAVSRRYEPNFYGASSSPLQAGLPTDRLYAEWWLRSPRVTAALGGTMESPAPLERIEVPHAISCWKQDSQLHARAAALQESNRHRFQAAFARGLAVVGFALDAEGNGAYLLADATGLPSPT